MFNLLRQKRFAPFFICQFCGATNDNIFRLGLVAMLSFGIFKSESSGLFIPLSAGLFMLPFFLFSAAAGEMIDELPKRRVLIMVKISELVIMTIAAAGLVWQWLPVLLLCLFLTGVQSAFFGPIKYALLPSLLKKDELLNGNAWFSVSTFTAILLGTALGTIGGSSQQLFTALGVGFIVLSLIGLAAAYLVPLPQQRMPSRARFMPIRSFKTVYKIASADKQIFRCILAGSWFWLVGVMLLNELARLPYGEYILTLTAVLVGVAGGAFLCYIIFRNVITTKYTPLTLLIGGLLLWYISGNFNAGAGVPLFIAVALFTAAMTLYVVPLRTTVQALAPEAERAKVIAAYNIFNALFITCGTVIAVAIHAVSAGGNPSQTILQLTCLLSLIAVPYACSVVPIESVRRVLTVVLRRLFRVRIYGAEHLQEKSTYICNHQSLWDGIFLGVFLQSKTRQLCFPIDVEQSKRFVARQCLKLVRFYPLSPMEPQSIKRLIRDLQRDEHISPLIFPEGRITTTGHIMKSYPGAGIIAEKISHCQIIPVHINGLQYSTLSRMRGKLRLRLFPSVTINIFPPQSVMPPAQLRGEKRRHWLSTHLEYIMEDAAYKSSARDLQNLTACFADNAARHGANTPLFSEFPMRRLTYRQLYGAAYALGGLLARKHPPGSRIGLMLPSSVGAAACFYASVFHRLTPAFLNPSSGAAQSVSACKTAVLSTVYTSQRLLERSPATVQIVEQLKENGVEVVLLETLREQLTLRHQLGAALAAVFMQHTITRLPGYQSAIDEHTSILFTSGSEGAPKGVVLSHKNIVTNCKQILARIDINNTDVMLNTLPVFHSFGLMAGLILPVVTGTEAWQYPSPLHYKMVPEAAYFCNATIFFSTNTFLSNYGKTANPLSFVSLRLVFAGAEKLKEETRQLWLDKFGTRILEGYGVTETSPVIAVNSPLHNTTGTVGRVLPGLETRLQPVEDVARGGRLLVRGDNVMQGYFLEARPGQLMPPPDGWHDTGDIVEIDKDNYISILGRAKRFIKIAGEMVPLDNIEECLRRAWDGVFAVVGIADAKRGERLALMSTKEITRQQIIAMLKQNGLPELWQPRDIHIVKEIPLLSTGKTDYPAVKRVFEQSARDD